MKSIRALAALLGFLGVSFGAFGAHALDGALSAEAAAWWETATFYLLVHATAAFAVSQANDTAWTRLAGWAFILGSIVFPGTLYALSLGAPRITGAATPIGGVSFLFGWGALALGAFFSSAQD